MRNKVSSKDISEIINSLLEFISLAEKLKTTLRHSWTSNPERQESVAEHTWLMSLLALVLFEHIDTPVDKLKSLKMILVHDLGEAILGDIPAFEKSNRQETKHTDEKKAITKIAFTLTNKKVANEIVSLWEEFEVGISNEAKFAVAMDKIEVLIQHNNADIKSWADGDFNNSPYYHDDKFDFDGFMRSFKDRVDRDTMEKVDSHKLLHRVDKKHVTRWLKSK